MLMNFFYSHSTRFSLTLVSSAPFTNAAAAFTRVCQLVPLALLFLLNTVHAQPIPEYTIPKCAHPLTIDGKLTEPEWLAAPLTSKFVHIGDGSAARFSTQAKFLWDDQYLYIGFICDDPDVWATLKNRDESLYKGEVVEIFCDPDGDGLNYIELEINPLGTIMDLTMTKAYSAGGKSDLSWKLNLTAAISVDGTLNDSSDVDTKWYCEAALPFKELAFLAPSLHFPPKDGEAWRMLLARYDYERTGSKITEISAWSQTNSTTFHVPERFGRTIFSNSSTVSVERQHEATPYSFALSNYPNPFNPSTVIRYSLPCTSSVKLAIYDLFGREVATLVDQEQSPGWKDVPWNAAHVASGMYFYRLTAGAFTETKRLLLLQ
jgi:hypothetical protein